MTSDIPNFHKGTYGKVSSQNMNAMANAARHSRNDLETSPTPMARDSVAATGAWPILAKIGPKVFKGDQAIGYEWEQVAYEQDWAAEPKGRSYDETEDNYAVPAGVSRGDMNDVDAEGLYVHLHYTNSSEGMILYFILPGQAVTTTNFLQITEVHNVDPGGPVVTPYCTSFGDTRLYECELVKVDPSFFTSNDFNQTAAPFESLDNPYEKVYAYNLLEYSGGDLGGGAQITDCDVNAVLAVLPIGTLVLGKLLGQWVSDDDDPNNLKYSRAYAFSVVNDECVQCCINQEGLTTPERVNNVLQKKRRALSTTSILDEMTR